MRVLYLTMNPNRASTTTPTEGWIRCLRPLGLNPVVVTAEAGPFSDWTASQTIPTCTLALPHPSKTHPWPFARSLFHLVRIIRHHRIDLLHANEQNIYPIAQYAARLTGRPIVCSVHFTMQPNFCQWAFAGARQPDRLLLISRGNHRACRPGLAGVVDESVCRILYNGIDLDHFRPDPALRNRFRDEMGCRSDTRLIGCAAALRPRKQLEHLFAAARRLADRHDLRILVAGAAMPGDQHYADHLFRDARATLGERFVELGHLDDLRPLLNGLDLFVNTSREEACSISVIESLACGTPVVGYPSRSVDEQVRDAGQIVEQDDLEQLTDMLDCWLADRHRLLKTRRIARRRAEEDFDIRVNSRRLWREYHHVLAERKGYHHAAA